MKKLILSAVAGFVLVFVTDFVIHGMMLKPTYDATSHLWRPEADMPGFMGHMMLGQLLIGVFFAWVFAHGYKGTGFMEGVRFGLFMGFINVGRDLIMYAVSPYPMDLLTAWVAAGMVQSVVIGVVISMIWGKDRLN